MYYINPWVFYIISLIAHIQIACICIVFGGGAIWLIGLFAGPGIIDECTDSTEK